jgi:hypothetical protein
VKARISGTPSDIAKSERLVAQPYPGIPEAEQTKIPAIMTERSQTTRRIFLREIFIVFIYRSIDKEIGR